MYILEIYLVILLSVNLSVLILAIARARVHALRMRGLMTAVTLLTMPPLRDLTATPWGRYMALVYGSGSFLPEDFPLSIAYLRMLYTDRLLKAGLRVPQRNGVCPIGIGLLWNMSGTNDAPSTVWIATPADFRPREPFASGALVEVIHCANRIADAFERVGCWMYHAPGSGVHFDLGRTIAFADHRDAVRFFLPDEICGDNNCADFFPQLWAAAKARGYQSVQFTNHRDMRCGYVALEIVDVAGVGTSPCCGADRRAAYRSGYKGRLPLLCDESAPCMNAQIPVSKEVPVDLRAAQK